MPFDYGKKLPNGQWENHPSNLEGEVVRPYRDTYVHDKCGVATKMPAHCAETYQRNPKFYTSTFCVGCGEYLPVGEFKWEDGQVLGS